LGLVDRIGPAPTRTSDRIPLPVRHTTRNRGPTFRTFKLERWVGNPMAHRRLAACAAYLLCFLALMSSPAWTQEPRGDASGQTPAKGDTAEKNGAPAKGETADKSLGDGLSTDMKLDDLVQQDVVIPAMSQVVETADRQVSTVGRTPAAVFVITQDM